MKNPNTTWIGIAGLMTIVVGAILVIFKVATITESLLFIGGIGTFLASLGLIKAKDSDKR